MSPFLFKIKVFLSQGDGTLRRSIRSTTTRNGVRTAEVGVRLHLVAQAKHFDGYEDGRGD